MPRSGRGGARTGTPGTAYSNRTDLQQPVTTVPSQEYGQRTAQEQQQRAIPLPQVAPAGTPLAPAGANPPVPPPPVTPLDAPTTRPNEPITHGLPSGPGAGPDVLGIGSPQSLSQLLDSLAQDSPAVAQLAAYVQSGRT